jgi:type I restriction enzyme R subunit
MISNFDFIQSPFSKLASSLKQAEQQLHAAPVYAAILCRKSLEEWVRWLYENDGDLSLPYDTTLNALMFQQDFKDLVPQSLLTQINLVRKLGNDAVHTNLKITPTEALHALQLMFGFASWVVRIYSDVKPTIPKFDEALVPVVTDVVKTKKELKDLKDAFLQTQQLNRQLEDELARIKANKDAHQQHVPPPVDPNEAITRKIYINLLLKEAGWDPDGKNVCEYPVTGIPTNDGKNNGFGKVDYVLWGDDGKPLAVVEAKRTSKDARAGQHQAKLYANCLQQMFQHRPVIIYTNGFKTWMWDDLEYAPRRVNGYYKKDELTLLVQRRSTRTSLQEAPIDAAIVDRYYQIEAIRSVGRVLENHGREALLIMATGTGKTRTAAALVDVLSKCNWVKRVLFLADRSELIKQAKTAFNIHLPQLPSVNLAIDKDNTQARVVFCTYQTMINKIDSEFDNNERHFSIGHFDLVIFDEIHRSVYSKYKAIFEYFDAYKIGLTATPKSDADKDTYELFGLQPGNPTFAYELEEAVARKYLVPPKAISVPVKFQRQGITYKDLSAEEKLKYEELFADPITGQVPDNINKSALNKWLFNTGTVDKVIGHLMKHGIKVAGGDRLGKTIIFAASHKHALFIEERFHKQYPELKGDFCRIIDNYENYASDLLKTFKIKEQGPHIAISVDMLDTGIDVPEIVNLVFFKTVLSKTKYWQMIGRGTRLCKDLLAPGVDKTHFVIFDFCENFEFFGEKPEGVSGSTAKTLSQRLFEQRLKLTALLQKQPEEELHLYAKQIQHYLFKQVQSLEDSSFLVRQHWQLVEKYKELNHWNALTESEMKELIAGIGPLIIETDQDELAKRFDNLSYSIQLDLLLKGVIADASVDNVQELAAKLSKKLSVPAVAAKLSLIKQIQTAPYWKDITLLKAEELRKDMRGLMRFIDKADGKVIYSQFEDDYSGDVTEHEIVYGSNDLEAYRKRVTHYIQEHQNIITIYKLKKNIPITATELATLDKMLFEQGEMGNREQFENAYGKQPLGKFIRSIIGLEMDAAKSAFSNFINAPALNPQQIRFLDTIITYLTVNGTIDPAALFAPPFTDISSNGIMDVFNTQQSAEIFSMVERVNKNATVTG